MTPTGLTIAVVENKEKSLHARVELVERWFPGNTIFPYRCADDVIDHLENPLRDHNNRKHIIDVIISDVFMPPRGENPEEEGTWEDGAFRVFKWLESARKKDDDFQCVQLVLISRTEGRSLPVGILTPDHMYWLSYRRETDSPNWPEWDFFPVVLNALNRAAPPPRHCELTQSRSAKVRAVYEEARNYAQGDDPVMITGGSGVGKEVLAKFIRDHSPRRDRPYVVVNLAALQDTLFESELYGFEKGHFTGPTESSTGRCGEAQHGTLFLDEIGEVPLAKWRALNRLVAEGEISRIGGTNDNAKVDIRIIAATSRNLTQMVKDGSFDGDLLGRFLPPLRLPPLSERMEDFEMLSEQFVREFSDHFNLIPRPQLTREALEVLRTRPWPQNIRQLRFEIRAALWRVKGEGKDLILASHLSAREDDQLRARADFPGAGDGAIARLRPDKPTIEALIDAIVKYAGNVSKVSRELGISRTAIGDRADAFPILKYTIENERKAQKERVALEEANLRATYPETAIKADPNFFSKPR